jgi:hypothetical protein
MDIYNYDNGQYVRPMTASEEAAYQEILSGLPQDDPGAIDPARIGASDIDYTIYGI